MKNWTELKSCLMAELHLRKESYEILSRGYHCRYGQVDLVALKDDGVHFIKVLGPNREMQLTTKEREELQNTAAFYISAHEMETPYRFDLIQGKHIEYLGNTI